MKTVSRDEMVRTWEKLCDLDAEQSAALSKKFLAAQPALGVYLLVWSQNVGHEGGPRPVIELALTIWKVLTEAAGKSMAQVTPEAVDQAESANTQSLEILEEASEFQWQHAVRELLNSYNQREIFGFCIEVLMKDDADQPELAPDQVGADLIVLKTIIDCLDQ
jgi:hypothetical protein